MTENTRKGKADCIICGVVLPTVYHYHKHNLRHHSLAQLSRAILKLRNLQLPLKDPLMTDNSDNEDDEDEKEEDGRCRAKEDKHLAEILGLPIKVESMDEVIELGPTDNADDLQVQRRLVKNPREAGQRSSQVIEVKENYPPPCYINPLVEDPDAIIVKFNRDIVMAQEKNCQSMCTTGDQVEGRMKHSAGQLRAIPKHTIQIPSRNAFILDYKKAQSRSTDKYIMQNVSPVEPPPKRRRGRPKKNSGPIRQYAAKPHLAKKEEKLVESEDEDDLEGMADPPLFSDDEDEEDEAATVPNILRTRSGRAIKIKKEDEAYKYYDMPGRDQLDSKDFSGQQEINDTGISVPPPARKKKGRKRKHLLDSSEELSVSVCGNKDNLNNSIILSEKRPEVTITIKEETYDDYNIISVVDEKLDMETGEQMETDNSSDFGRSSASESFEGFECFLCFKVFNLKEECKKHLEDHINKVVDENESSECISRYFNKPCDKEVIHNQENPSDSCTEEDGQEDEATEKMHNHELLPNISEPCTEAQESFTCSICNESFDSQTALHNHTHDSAIECKFCGKIYQNRINLQTHIKRYHENTDWMKFKCATCGKSFGFLSALERHMKEHNPNQKFCCEQCGKVFKNLTNLKNHIPLHTKNEIYECPYCPKKYYLKYSYEKHVKTHICAPKFHCEICDKSFNERKYFEIHVERHQNGGCLGRSKDYRCNNCGDVKNPTDLDLLSGIDSGHHKTCLKCGKGLYKRYMIENLDTLMLEEKSERPREQCKICGKCVLNLARHMKNTHLENSYITCDMCGVMVTKGSISAHKNRKHGGSAVTCDHCNRVFKNIMCLREHMTKVRKREDPAKNVCKFCKEMIAPALWKEHMLQHRTKCNDCGAGNFQNHQEFLAHLEICRRCSNCGMTEFASRGEYLDHIEVCGSSIDIMTGTLDSPNDQEVVTSIFAIVDESTCCETCGEVFEDQVSLAHHITVTHPNILPSGPLLDETTMMNDIEAILYACPQKSCGAIVTSKESLKKHVTSVHNA